MKPIKLTLQAFGAFANKIDIDFEKLSSGGVFLISGETGSGKTTIFDAICYALYGEANGQDRDAKNFRSDYVNDSLDTFVNLVFECNGKRYEIQRSPEYIKHRVYKNGDVKAVKKSASVYLIQPNGETLEKVTHVDKAIQEIIGLDCEQFRQIVMIAQGEFKRFLVSNSDEKGKILNSVFGTQKFVNFKAVLDKKKDIAKNEYLESLNTSIGDILSIGYGTDWSYHQDFEVWKSQKNEDKDIEIVLENLKTYIGTLTIEESTLVETISNLEEKVTKLSSEVNAHTNMNQNILKRDSLLKDLEKINSQKDSIDSIKLKIKELDSAKSIEVQRIQYQNASNNVSRLKHSRDNNQAQLLKCKEYIELLSNQKLEICNILKISNSNEDVSIQANNMLNSLKSQLSEIEIQGKAYRAIIDSINRYTLKLSQLEEQREKLLKATKHQAELSQNYIEKENLYNLNIAGVLAEGLEEGMPCMVCGSVHHPQIAIKHHDAPSEGQLKSLKDELDTYRNRFNQIQTDFLIQQERLKNLKNDIIDSVAVLGISSQDVEEILQLLNTQRNILSAKYTDLKKEITIAGNAISKLNGVIQELKKYETNLVVLTANIENVTSQLETAMLDYNNLKDNYITALKDKNIPDEHTHIRLLGEYNNYESLSRAILTFESSLANCSIRINEYNDMIGDNTFVDVSDIETKLSEVENSLKINRNRNFEVSQRIKNNSAVYDKVSKNYKLILKKYQDYKDTEYLFKVASGTISGADKKIAFDNYVQAYYFEKVVAAANQKIHIMSEGRYTLVRMDESSKKRERGGLVIEVFDAYTGKYRASSTLCGGETFMVSLSLALGLSEVVQQQSGGIKIDAMFIDEGFGTLDSEQALQQAIKVLDSLAVNNRIVGIISHVNELKEHISNRLIVEKSPKGSNVTY